VEGHALEHTQYLRMQHINHEMRRSNDNLDLQLYHRHNLIIMIMIVDDKVVSPNYRCSPMPDTEPVDAGARLDNDIDILVLNCK